MNKIELATDFAYHYHKGQYRKHFPVPYLYHCFRVYHKILKWGIKDESLGVVALIHDTLEDTEATVEEIENKFGSNVAELVQALTFDPNSGTKQGYIDKLVEARIEVLVIKLADRICNVYDFLNSDRKYAKKYFEKANVLFNAFWNRKEEAIKTFNGEVFENIIDDIALLKLAL